MVSVVVALYNGLALTRACLDSLRGATEPLEVVAVDNGSTDGTAAYLDAWRQPYPLRRVTNAANVGLIRALNQGARAAGGDVLCFLHNDTEMREARWLGRLRAGLEAAPGAGLAGLYGARRLRRDGRYAGRSIVHCLEGAPPLPGGVVEVAAVDGVCLVLRRTLFEAVGGFDEAYGFFHGYDRDLSFAVREAGHRCVVVDAPFVHRGGGTRTGPDAPVRAAEDLVQRRAALARFAAKWRHRLPADVRTPRERLRDGLARVLGRGAYGSARQT
jgi:GT2 family glycosyltransferase